MTKTRLGKIQAAEFGEGGYQDVCIGLSLTMGGDGWGTRHFDGFWSIKRSDSCQWSEESRTQSLGETVMRVNELLKKAKARHVSDLVGKPVEVTFEGNVLKGFRILEEVL